MPAFAFDQLRRHPDVEAPNLFASDATDRLLLELAAGRLTGGEPVATVDDRYGALTLGALHAGASHVRVCQDQLTSEYALAANAARLEYPGTAYSHHALSTELLQGARTVLVQLPKSLDALRDIAEQLALAAVAQHGEGADLVEVYFGGRVKHMTLAMNDVIGDSFHDVAPTRASAKSRAVVARRPRADVTSSFPRREHLSELDLTVCAYGGTFGGATLDQGTRELLRFVEQMAPAAERIVDLGSGTGIIATVLARTRRGARVTATDSSAAAVASSRDTLAANGCDPAQTTVVRDDAMAGFPDASVDLVVCNPPFHIGSGVQPEAANRLFGAAARVLRPGGELWTVFNSHLEHRIALTQLVGPTRQVHRTSKFTITRSERR